MKKYLIRYTMVFIVLFLLTAMPSCSLKKPTYYGEWQIKKEIDWPMVQSSEFNSDAHIGKRIVYEKDRAVADGVELKNPIYQETIMTSDEYEDGYRMDFKKLGLKTDVVKRIEISDGSWIWENLGNTFFIIDKDTLVVWDYNCFLMKRVES